MVGEKLWRTYCDIQWQTVHKSEQYWELYRRWMVFLRTDYQLEEVNLVPCWNYPWLVRGAFAAAALLPVILFWGEGVAYLSSCGFMALVWMMAATYAGRRGQRLGRRHEHKWRPRKALEPFLSQDDWRAHESIAATMSIPPTPPPREEDPEEGDGRGYWGWFFAFLFSWMAPAWIPLLILWPVKWHGYYTLDLRTTESDALSGSADSA
jgi:hypothetical protein